ncbi:MAG: NYN domain-containing protein [bacterium]|nr:NYN domain-containing protein [bacterium]
MQIIVDGYNVINSWEFFKKKSNLDLEEKRNKLIDILLEFQSLSETKIVIVFDGRSVSRKREYFLGLEIVYSSKKETADTVIEKMVKERDKSTKVWIVTSDRNLRLHTFGNGALSMYTKELEEKVNTIFKENNLNLLDR